MQGDESTIGWDPAYIDRAPSTALRIYLLFLLIAILVAMIRLAKLWIAAPPFRLVRQASNPAYLHRLQASRSSLKQWLGCTFLGWGILASTTVAHACDLLLQSKAAGAAALLWAIKDLSVSLSLGLFVALFLFLLQWHLHNRLEHLRK